MNLYKRVLNKVEGFRNLSEDKKAKATYLYKNQFLGYVLLSTDVVLALLCITIVGLIFIILGMCLDNDVFSYISLGLTVVILPYSLMCIYLVSKQIIYRIKKYNCSVIAEFADKVANVYLLNSKVITQKAWRKIKKYNKWQYQYLRSQRSNHQCYEVTQWLAKFIKDPEIKILWISVEDIFDNHRYGHAILKKGDWVYDSNSRRTYKYEDYMKAYKAEIFKEISLNEDEYFEEDDWKEFGVWCKERKVKRTSED